MHNVIASSKNSQRSDMDSSSRIQRNVMDCLEEKDLPMVVAICSGASDGEEKLNSKNFVPELQPAVNNSRSSLSTSAENIAQQEWTYDISDKHDESETRASEACCAIS